ncbi:hypothetical protein GWI33_011213, partial [Rhynchophorus ferrugineus]
EVVANLSGVEARNPSPDTVRQVNSVSPIRNHVSLLPQLLDFWSVAAYLVSPVVLSRQQPSSPPPPPTLPVAGVESGLTGGREERRS